MKTVLDLVGEFASINDEKTRCGGRLPPDWERRWAELKGFYDLLMAQDGKARRPLSRRFSTSDIRRRVRDRERLRVPANLDVVLRFEGEYYPGQVGNLSCGGAFLASQVILPVHSQVILYLANPYGRQAALLQTEGEVRWTCQGASVPDLPCGMGVRFRAEESVSHVHHQLDSIVVETLEDHLSGVDASAIAPHFLERESLVL